MPAVFHYGKALKTAYRGGVNSGINLVFSYGDEAGLTVFGYGKALIFYNS